MFRYNPFWHFWFQLDNRYYLRTTVASITTFILSAVLFIVAASIFPALWAMPLLGLTLVIVPALIIGTVIPIFAKISNFLYHKQNQKLNTIKSLSNDDMLKNQIDLYLNRRVVCPHELLKAKHLNLPEHHHDINERTAVAEAPLILEVEDTLDVKSVTNNALQNRNPSFKATNKSNQLFIKQSTAKDALSEISAREMAELLGFKNLIPSNTLTKADTLENGERPNEGLILSKQKIEDFINQENAKTKRKPIKNTPQVQGAVAKFILILKTALYRNQAMRDKNLKLLYIQKFTPHTSDGLKWFNDLFNEVAVAPGAFYFEHRSKDQKRAQRATAQRILQHIDITSFQDNFLLHLILGSQDANAGNTLFSEIENSESIRLYSVDHERIMPEDNYNITKKIPIANGATTTEKDVAGVFPIRLWLAGLPQAEAPFTRDIIEKTLRSLDSERLLAYHQQKKLFSPAAIGAQLERVLLIKTSFEAALNEPVISLTPRALFLKLINNHPTYDFLKNTIKLNELVLFSLLGQVPENADVSRWRHPLQYNSIIKVAQEAVYNEREGRPPFSKASFRTPHSHNLMFFSLAKHAALLDKANQPGIDILTEISSQFNSM